MFVIIEFIFCLFLLTFFANNQLVSQIFDRLSITPAWAQDEDKDADSKKSMVCSRLFDSEACENMSESDIVEQKELTEDEEAIINRYMEAAETEQTPSNNSLKTGSEIDNNSNDSSSSGGSTILSNEIPSKDVTNTNQQINSGLLSTQLNRSSINSSNVSTNSQNLNNLNQFQLVDLIASTISNANNIDNNKVIQSINDLIGQTKANGGNVIDLLKKIADGILKDPSGSIANKLINISRTK